MKRPSSLLGLDIIGDDAEDSEDCYNEDEIVEEHIDDDENDDSLLHRAFYVEGELPPEAGPPQNGVDYLKHVKWEARRIPSTIVADVDSNKLFCEKSHRSKYLSLIRASSINTDCIDEVKPSAEWESHFLKKFTKLKSEIEKKRLQKVKIAKKRKIDLPHKDDVNEWLDFCLVKHPVPSLSVLYSMDNVTISTLVDILAVKLCEKHDDCDEVALHKWLFCLLTHLEVPLIAETSASLRSVLKYCAKQRSLLTKEECSSRIEQVARLNIMITICAGYFSQG